MYVWTAGHNMPGYLPETEPAAFRTRLDALEYMVSELRRVADMGDDDADGAALEEAADALAGRDADVDGEWWWMQPDGRIAYWITCVDMPDDEAAAALEGDA